MLHEDLMPCLSAQKRQSWVTDTSEFIILFLFFLCLFGIFCSKMFESNNNKVYYYCICEVSDVN
jgi:hypothetical protein